MQPRRAGGVRTEQRPARLGYKGVVTVGGWGDGRRTSWKMHYYRGLVLRYSYLDKTDRELALIGEFF